MLHLVESVEKLSICHSKIEMTDETWHQEKQKSSSTGSWHKQSPSYLISAECGEAEMSKRYKVIQKDF